MNKKTQVPMNSIAVALLAIAVIVLAIKEPHCNCENSSETVQTPIRQQTTAPRRSRTQIQRELGKF